METKIKGVSFCSVYDEKKFDGEINDEPSKTVTTGYIPINEQVKMIMRGEITVGDYDGDYVDDDNLDEIPEEYFEDATDYVTAYSDELSEALNTIPNEDLSSDVTPEALPVQDDKNKAEPAECNDAGKA